MYNFINDGNKTNALKNELCKVHTEGTRNFVKYCICHLIS